MSPATFGLILEKIRPLISKPKQDHEPRKLLNEEKLLATLYYLMSGSTLQAVGLAFSISVSSLAVFIPQFCGYIWEAFKVEAFPPLTRDCFQEIAQGKTFHCA